MNSACNRRAFLKNSLTATTGLGLTLSSGLLAKTTAWANQPAPQTMPKQPLGKTGHMVSIFSLGGETTVEQPANRDKAIDIINHAIDLGVNYIDTAALYGRDGEERLPGASEINVGAVMKHRRKEVFLATKSHDYTYDGTMRLFEDSIRRLQTDYLDLYQHHYVGNFGTLEDLRRKPSARSAFEKLKEQGVIKNIGITGHSSRLLWEALNDYPYDCVLITLNAGNRSMNDPEYLDRFFDLATEKKTGIIAMKVAHRGRMLRPDLTIRQLLPYTMSFPVSTTIMGITAREYLDENVRIASSFQKLSSAEMAEIRRLAQS
jgi:uncharacterized protein